MATVDVGEEDGDSRFDGSGSGAGDSRFDGSRSGAGDFPAKMLKHVEVLKRSMETYDAGQGKRKAESTASQNWRQEDSEDEEEEGGAALAAALRLRTKVWCTLSRRRRTTCSRPIRTARRMLVTARCAGVR